jgi:anti-sigma factor ChrR (cupin superfamily)
MSSSSDRDRCERGNLVAAYVLAFLERGEAQLMQAHLADCARCWREYQALSAITDALWASRTQMLPPSAPLWDRLAQRVAGQVRKPNAVSAAAAGPSASGEWPETRWEEVATGITCKLLSTDVETDRVSMLVRLGAGVAYPPHRHASVEELYLLEGELWIEDRKLVPGDYNRAEPGTSDQRVWSATGCMCLLITSPSDQLA